MKGRNANLLLLLLMLVLTACGGAPSDSQDNGTTEVNQSASTFQSEVGDVQGAQEVAQDENPASTQLGLFLPPSPMQLLEDAEQRTLNHNWNLVSLPIEQTKSALDFLQDFPNVHSIWRYDAEAGLWRTFPKQSNLPELAVVTPDDGYWLRVVGEVDLDGQGRTPNLYSFYKGWNLVGYSHSSPEVTVDEFLEDSNYWQESCATRQDVVSIWAWTGNTWEIFYTQDGKLESFNEQMGTDFQALTHIQPGFGYWLHMSADTTPPSRDNDCMPPNPGETPDPPEETTTTTTTTLQQTTTTTTSTTTTTLPPDEDVVCDEDLAFFETDIWEPILSTTCIGCHIEGGFAQSNGARFYLKDVESEGYLLNNFENMRAMSEHMSDGEPLLLLKPTAQVSHRGGEQIVQDSSEYLKFQQMIERFNQPSCVSNPDPGEEPGENPGEDPSNPPVTDDETNALRLEELQSRVVTLNGEATLRKATFALTSRQPTTEEIAAVNEGGEVALTQVLLAQMEEEAFYDRLKEIYNDLLLTNRYLPGTHAINLLDSRDYPERYWFDIYKDNEETKDKYNTLKYYSSNGVARSPLELIAHVVRQNRPFTEILSADYIMVTPFSARVYGIQEGAYNDLEDPSTYDTNTFYEARIPGIPHAGILTDPMFLNRFPTTSTNRNRHRARMVYLFFLNTDILKAGMRPIDPTKIVGHNPTLFNPTCSACHSLLDPIAGSLKNWDSRGGYDNETWYQEMRPPGFEGQLMDVENYPNAAQWLAQRIIEDPRFVESVVRTMYTGYTGQEPLLAPTQEMDSYEERLEAYGAQQAMFKQVGEAFVADNYNLKTAIKELMLSVYFRAQSTLETEPDYGLETIGTSRLLTPEQLDRKITSLLGYEWFWYGDQKNLLNSSRYKLLYGGIDSDTVIKRVTDPNGIMASIQLRMANELSCSVVAHDFIIPEPERRRLFPFVEPSYEPESADGFEVPAAKAAILHNIQYLHRYLLNEDLPLSDPEIERTYQLFYQTWQEGNAKMAVDEVDDWMNWSCRARHEYGAEADLPKEQWIERDQNYTVRAWMAVITYMLIDYKFLYE